MDFDVLMINLGLNEAFQNFQDHNFVWKCLLLELFEFLSTFTLNFELFFS